MFLFVLWRRLIRKLLTLLANLINLITLEDSPDYTWKRKAWKQIMGNLIQDHSSLWLHGNCMFCCLLSKRSDWDMGRGSSTECPWVRNCLVLVSWEEVLMISGSKREWCHGKRLTGCSLFLLWKLSRNQFSNDTNNQTLSICPMSELYYTLLINFILNSVCGFVNNYKKTILSEMLCT